MNQMIANDQLIVMAATPAEMRDHAPMPIRFGLARSLFGTCLIGECPHGICHLSFHDESADEAGLQMMCEDWPGAELIRDDPYAAALVGKIFDPAGPDISPMRLFVSGTPFQLRVWAALLQIPTSRTVSYQSLATSLGNPKASRAVGGAVGANRIAYLIPCHRVIHENGDPGNYRWGSARKQAMLEWETAGVKS